MSCNRCGSSETWVPTYCNWGHCAVCFAPLDPDHECAWYGLEHESFSTVQLPGNVHTMRERSE